MSPSKDTVRILMAWVQHIRVFKRSKTKSLSCSKRGGPSVALDRTWWQFGNAAFQSRISQPGWFPLPIPWYWPEHGYHRYNHPRWNKSDFSQNLLHVVTTFEWCYALCSHRGETLHRKRDTTKMSASKKKSMVIMAVMVLRIKQLPETYSKFKT